MKRILSTLLLLSIIAVSCEEVPIAIDTSERGKDTTYIVEVEAKQTKMYYIEELSGVQCVNCPDGASELHTLATTGEFKDQIIINTIHAGKSFTNPIEHGDVVSSQDFRTDEGESILTNMLGGDPGKPCAGFDRMPLSTNSTSPILDYRNRWNTIIGQVKTENAENPVNVSITTQLAPEPNTYYIQVHVAYLTEMSSRQALSVYLTEDKIIDAQISKADYLQDYEHNHIFRKSISPYNGLEILPALSTKEAGRVLIQNFVLTINPSDAKQKFWKAENMHVVAFVHSLEGDKRVYQAAQVNLLP